MREAYRCLRITHGVLWRSFVVQTSRKKAARQSYSRAYAVKDLVSVTAFFSPFVRRSDHIRMGNAQHRERAHPAKAKETGDGCVERQGAGSVLR
jgi:hypothetical protein